MRDIWIDTDGDVWLESPGWVLVCSRPYEIEIRKLEDCSLIAKLYDTPWSWIRNVKKIEAVSVVGKLRLILFI